ncbi:MAG: GNAT family N-acetyltransferase [Candidatus Acidiferrum sp.]
MRSSVKTLPCEPLLAATPLYSLSLAQTNSDVAECQRLRYLVFNLELGEGLSSSERSGLDIDPFDSLCEHLMVKESGTGRLVGTYRLQTGENALRNLGYYGEQIFDFGPFAPIREQILELGRACVHQEFRNTTVLYLLWKGIAIYASRSSARYLLGCNSLSTQKESEGAALFEALKNKYLVEEPFRTLPQPGCHCRWDGTTIAVRPPRLFRAYLEISARLCGPPAIDREFKTIDFLTIVDLERIPDRVRARFF